MVLILLSTPNHTNSFWPSTPRSLDMSPLMSPRTPLTPSPSFFAILSPIFTADDNVPATPTLLQMSPGMVPPETPPPWLLAAQSPGITPRPALSRSTSASSSTSSTITRTTGNLTPFSRPQQRPTFPSTTYSFTAGHAQVFRPPPPLALKRVKTTPVARGPSSPLRQALNASSSQALPDFNARSSTNETAVESVYSSCIDGSYDSSSAEVVTIGMANLDMQPLSRDYESMDIPIALEAAPATPDTGRTITPALHLANIRAQEARHCRSPSTPLTSRKEYFTLSFKPTDALKSSESPQQSRSVPHRHSMSIANLKQFEKETGSHHIKTKYEVQ